MTRANKSGGGRTTFILSAALIGLLVIAAVVVLILNMNRGGEPDPSPTPPPTGSETPAPTETAGAESICGLPSSDETDLSAAPAVEWTPVGVIAAPADPAGAHGPGVQEDDGFRSCYSHSPTGALLAISNYLALTSEPALQERLDELVADDSTFDAAASEGYGDTRLSIVGFRLLRYTDERAVIDLAVRVDSAEGVLLSTPFEVVWQDGDWKIVVGDEPPASAPLQSLGGYVSFSGDTDGQ